MPVAPVVESAPVTMRFPALVCAEMAPVVVQEESV